MDTTEMTVYILILFIGLLVVIGPRFYVKAPPNNALIISGIRNTPRILVGKGGIKIPFFERIDELFLGQISVDIKTERSVPTNDFINVKVDAVAKIRVGTSVENIQLAAKNFLNFSPEQIAADLQDSLEGNMREIIGTLSLEAINTDRDGFSDQVLSKASADMQKLGIEILSCNIQNVTDDNGLIQDLGADNTAKIKKNASISKALAERDVAVAQAEATKVANDAKVESELAIAQRNNDLAIRQAELKQEADIKKAVADAAYKIQEQEQQKTIQTKVVEVEIVKAEKEADLKKQEVLIKQQILEAEIQKKAEADKFAIERDAEAKLAQKRAEAEALRYSLEQEAIGIKAKGEAEATAIRAKGEAEALAMERKADAYKKYNNAAIVQMIVATLPSLASEIAKPLSSIDKVTIFGDGKVDSVSANVPLVLSQTFATVKEATGVDLADIVKANTYDAKVTKNINIASGNKELTDSITKVLKDLPESEQEKNE